MLVTLDFKTRFCWTIRQHMTCRSAKKAHKNALMGARAFWALLLHSVIKFETLASAIITMDAAICAADVVYKSVLKRHSNSSKLIRMWVHQLPCCAFWEGFIEGLVLATEISETLDSKQISGEIGAFCSCQGRPPQILGPTFSRL